MPGQLPLSAERARWIATHILPHEPALRRQLNRWRLPDGLEGDDVIQEAYARLAGVADFARIDNPRAYLFSTARMVVLAYLRRGKVVSIQALEGIDQKALHSEDPGPEDIASERQQFHRLAEMISELPPPGPEIMRLRMIEELNHREIGERLGLSTNAVQKLLARNLAKFVERLGRGGISPADASTEPKTSQNQDSRERPRNQHGD